MVLHQRIAIDRAVLRTVSFFSSLSDELLLPLSGLLRERRYRRGEVIFHQGDEGTCLYLVLSGRVRIYIVSPDGREATVRYYGSDTAFGEFAVLDGAPRSATAAAVEDVTTLVLYRDDLMGLLRSHFTLVEQLLAMLTERLRYTTGYVEQLAFLSVPGRVAATLLHLAEAQAAADDPLRITLTQQDLASLVSTTREWVNRALREFAVRGIIRIGRGEIIVLDRAALARHIQ